MSLLTKLKQFFSKKPEAGATPAPSHVTIQITPQAGSIIYQDMSQAQVAILEQRYPNHRALWKTHLLEAYASKPSASLPSSAMGFDLLSSRSSKPLFGDDLQKRREEALAEVQKKLSYGDYLLSFLASPDDIKEFHVFLDIYLRPEEIAQFFHNALFSLAGGLYTSRYDTAAMYWTRTSRLVFEREFDPSHPSLRGKPLPVKPAPAVFALRSAFDPEDFKGDFMVQNVDYVSSAKYLWDYTQVKHYVETHFEGQVPHCLYLGGLSKSSKISSMANSGSRSQIFIYDKGAKEAANGRYGNYLRIEFRFRLKPSDFRSQASRVSGTLGLLERLQFLLRKAQTDHYAALHPHVISLRSFLVGNLLRRGVCFRQPPRPRSAPAGAPVTKAAELQRLDRWPVAPFWDYFLQLLSDKEFTTTVHEDLLVIARRKNAPTGGQNPT